MSAQSRAHSLPALLLAKTLSSCVRQDCCLLAAVVLATSRAQQFSLWESDRLGSRSFTAQLEAQQAVLQKRML
jgi:hypothetical protein